MSEQTSAQSDSTELFFETVSSFVSFLEFRDILACRLVATETLNQIHASLTVDECADHLSLVLQERNAVVMDSTNNWKQAGSSPFDLSQCLRQIDTDVTNPLDAALRVARTLQCLPQELAVLYSGKYGRHCVPCNPDSGNLVHDAYPKCKRGKEQCPTCAVKIPPRTAFREDQDEDDDTYTEGSVYSELLIHVRNRDRNKGRYSIDLESFHCKCIPNLPPDLMCPICRTSNQRTLVLSAFSYQAEPSSAREQPGHMSLSFTPCLESETKRIRRDERDDVNPFPPEYSDMFIPRRSGLLILRQLFQIDCKHAMAIHCSLCHKFGLIAPARLCMPCHLRNDQEEHCVGGVLFRPTADNDARMHCRYCTVTNSDRRDERRESSEEEEEGEEESHGDSQGEMSTASPSQVPQDAWEDDDDLRDPYDHSNEKQYGIDDEGSGQSHDGEYC